MKLSRLVTCTLLLASTGAFSQDLKITGVVDGPLPGGLPKAIEIEAVNAIADLSRCGVGAANNGGGTDGQEFTFPGDTLAVGDVVYVATEDANFTSFFGFAPTYISTTAASINGDDAIELFCDGAVIDTFGEIDVDGSGQPWEYTDGWAKRLAMTGPDGASFVFANWTFSGPNALDNETTNATAAVPFPISAPPPPPPPPPPPTGGLVINEFQYDPAPDIAGDANGDGVRDGSQDEFVELVNDSGADLDLSGWTLNDAVGLRHMFPAGTVVADGCAIVVFGGGTPVGSFGGSVIQVASTGFIGLNNGGDSITILDSTGAQVATASYTNEAPDQSLTLDPDISGAPTPHSAAAGSGGALFSPGTRIDGTAFAGCAAPPAAGLVINEFQYDPAPDVTGDANGDGVRDGSQDEFIELVNNSSADVDISGWTINDAVGVRHTFPAGSTVAANCAIVVFGGGTPFGGFGASEVQTASTGFLGLNNGGDTITVFNDLGMEVATASYSNEAPDQSLTLDPDIVGSPTAHSVATGSGGALFSPGTRIDGTQFSGCPIVAPLVLISAVQGPGTVSPLVDAPVTIEGIVTGDFQDGDADNTRNLRGFYVQEESTDDDGNTATSEGVFVFETSLITDVNVGDKVQVSGTVAEFFGETQVVASTVTVTGTGSIAPTLVTLPVANAILNADNEFIADLENVEGMLVEVAGPLNVTEMFNLDRFGEMRLAEGGRLFQFTNMSQPDVAGFQQHLEDIAKRNIFLDDGLSVQNPDPIRYPTPDGLPNSTGAAVRMDDLVSGLVGNIRFSRGSGGSGDEAYRLMPVQDPTFTPNNIRPETPDPVGGTLRVASFNVLNYFTTIDTGADICGPLGTQGCRGADSQLELDRQTEKLINALLVLDADVLGLIELENNASASLSALVDAANAALGDSVYAFIDTGTIGGDAIKVGFIYKPGTVTPSGPFAVLDSTVDPTFIDTLNRPVLAQTFVEVASGEAVTIAVNHLKSKGSDCNDVGDPDVGDGQGNCNGTRTSAAIAQANWLATDPTGSGDEDFLIIGDLNAYLLEDPLSALESLDYENLLKTFIGPSPYGFVFDGQAGALDHALATPSLVSQVTGVTEWHINADEADAIDYNLNFSRNPAIFDGTIVFRASDHDPVIVGLALSSPLLGDIDGDGDVDTADLVLLLRAFGSREGGRRYNPAADLDSNGRVGFVDLLIFLDALARFNNTH
ncbi:MAG: ExeM/NucH family extracellular endonuclease [Pseudomonadota bacterium]